MRFRSFGYQRTEAMTQYGPRGSIEPVAVRQHYLEDTMNKLTVAAGWAAAVLMAANMAWAAPKPADAAGPSKSANVTGKIQSVDVVNEVVTLDSGKYYMIPPAIKLDGFKAGDQVTISVDKDAQGNGTNRANALTKN
jgi:Cu/Ag efflux protein CusF